MWTAPPAPTSKLLPGLRIHLPFARPTRSRNSALQEVRTHPLASRLGKDGAIVILPAHRKYRLDEIGCRDHARKWACRNRLGRSGMKTNLVKRAKRAQCGGAPSQCVVGAVLGVCPWYLTRAGQAQPLRDANPQFLDLNSRSCPLLPSHRLSLILFLQPLFQRGKVVADGRGVHLPLAGQGFEGVGPGRLWPISSILARRAPASLLS